MSAYSKPCGLELNCLWLFLPWFNYEKVRVAFKRKITNIPPSAVCGLQLWAAWQPRTNSFLLEAKQFPFSLTPLWLAGFSQLKKSGKCDLMLRNSILALRHGFCYFKLPTFICGKTGIPAISRVIWLTARLLCLSPSPRKQERSKGICYTQSLGSSCSYLRWFIYQRQK